MYHFSKVLDCLFDEAIAPITELLKQKKLQAVIERLETVQAAVPST